MTRRRKLILAGTLITLIAGLAVGQAALEARIKANSVEVPLFEVDPFWPKPLPDNWVLGTVIGVGVDSRDHVYIVHRPETINPVTEGGGQADPPLSECCVGAPPVIEFDPEGNVVRAWGGESGENYTWPGSNHGIAVDHLDNVWIGGNGMRDSHIVKFTRDGQFLAQYGEAGRPRDSESLDHFGGVAKIAFDLEANEAYIADGYGHRRVAVLDMTTGDVKRIWGAYGNPPQNINPGPYDPEAPPAEHFRTPVHCADPSHDGYVYVCDRPSNRLQVFRTDGTFVKEAFYAPETFGDGAVWDIAFSHDPEQRFIYLADGKNMLIYVLDRETLEVLTTFGSGGRQPGQFFAVHSIATDSRGNIYTTETYQGRRVQKFAYKGMGPAPAEHQRTVWPQRP